MTLYGSRSDGTSEVVVPLAFWSRRLETEVATPTLRNINRAQHLGIHDEYAADQQSGRYCTQLLGSESKMLACM
jgi:hypothetical protein